MMQHLRWTQHGEVRQDETRPSLLIERIGLPGDCNVDVHGDGSEYQPYVLTGSSLRHGDSACEFADGWQVITRLGQTLVSQSRLYVQRDIAGTWTDVPHGIPTRNVLENYPRDGKATAYLDFPDIQGYAAGARLQVGVEVGGSDQAIYGFRFRSPVAGTFRLEWVLDVPANLDLSWIEEPTSKTDPTPIRVGGKIGTFGIRWTTQEAPNRSVTVENHGAAGRTIHLYLGPYTVAAQEWLTIYPDATVTDTETADWTTRANTVNTGTFSVVTGDVLVAFACAVIEVGEETLSTPPTGTCSVTWTRVQNYNNGSDDVAQACWTATVGSDQSAVYTTFGKSGYSWRFGGTVYKISGASGLGTSNVANGSGTNPRVTLTGVAASSVIVQFVGDWNAVDMTSSPPSAYTTDAGSLATPLNVNFYVSGAYSGLSGYYPNAGSAGNKTVGWTTTSLKWVLIAAEVTVSGGGGVTISVSETLTMAEALD